jgi:type IV secretory pathway VirB10-like protein
MTDRETRDNAGPTGAASIPPEELELRARPAPITRINRKVLFGVVFVGLSFLAGLVIVALNPPRFTNKAPSELYNVDQKAVTDALSKLPSSYEGLNVQRPAPQVAQGPTATGPAAAAPLGVDPAAELEQAERARVARLATQARESGIFFRLQLKAPPRRDDAAEAKGSAEVKGATAAPAPQPSDRGVLTTAHRVGADATEDVFSAEPTDQTRKLAFLKSGPEKDIYNPHGLQTPVSSYQLMAGTIISASLVTGLNSDLPGFVIAQVTEHVYDTTTGRNLLVPQGTRLVGKYDSVVAFGQERALVVWQRLIFPDGSSIVIDNLPATDTGGYAGLADEVDLHTWKLLKGVALATVLGVGSQLAFGSGSSLGDSDLIKALRESTQSTTNRAGQRLVERNLNVQPTITVRPGWPLRVIVHKDLILRPYRGTGLTTR